MLKTCLKISLLLGASLSAVCASEQKEDKNKFSIPKGLVSSRKDSVNSELKQNQLLSPKGTSSQDNQSSSTTTPTKPRSSSFANNPLLNNGGIIMGVKKYEKNKLKSPENNVIEEKKEPVQKIVEVKNTEEPKHGTMYRPKQKKRAPTINIQNDLKTLQDVNVGTDIKRQVNIQVKKDEKPQNLAIQISTVTIETKKDIAQTENKIITVNTFQEPLSNIDSSRSQSLIETNTKNDVPVLKIDEKNDPSKRSSSLIEQKNTPNIILLNNNIEEKIDTDKLKMKISEVTEQTQQALKNFSSENKNYELQKQIFMGKISESLTNLEDLNGAGFIFEDGSISFPQTCDKIIQNIPHLSKLAKKWTEVNNAHERLINANDILKENKPLCKKLF